MTFVSKHSMGGNWKLKPSRRRVSQSQFGDYQGLKNTTHPQQRAEIRTEN